MPRKRGTSSQPPAKAKNPATTSKTSSKTKSPGRRAKRDPAGEKRDATPSGLLAVVGIGASAGGLHALQGFFDALPDMHGVAFVVVQHLDPTHKSETAVLLRPHSRLPVVEVTDNQTVEPDHVYVIPPNRELTIHQGLLHLAEPAARRGMRMPIDGFLRSLADDQQERTIGIILSGTGSDGALGLKAIKAAGGLTMTQDPDTAEYDGMPRSAMATGVVDFVLAVEKLPRVLYRYARRPYLNQSDGAPSIAEQGPAPFKSILTLLRARTKYDFGSYKKGTISRRIERRMSLKHLERVEDYVKYLQDHPAEVNDLFKDLLINVTTFFREPQAWEYLEQDVLPRLIKERAAEGVLRFWVPGCATGEEAYSLAMLALEQTRSAHAALTVQVFASDLDQSALEFARAGIYPESIAADVPPGRLRRFFVKGDHTYRIAKPVREAMVFSVQNLISDPPFSRLDLISCRNLMIYLAPEIQQKIIALFHFALRPGGYLFLGNAESVGSQTDLFEPVSKKWRIYRRIGPVRHDRIEFPVVPSEARAGAGEPRAMVAPSRENRLLAVAQSVVLERYVPASALVNAKEEILYLFGATDRFLVQPTGQLTPDILSWSRSGIRSKLRSALREAIQHKRRATVRGAVVRPEGDSSAVRITVDPLVVPKEIEGCYLVVFEDEGPARLAGPPSDPAEESALQQMDDDLSVLREELQTSVEQFEASNEELKSANEEMMSMNEELQSTNEELETSKEELQSLNEELSTVNTQLENKVQELEATNDDLKNLLSSTNIATIFLDRQFRIKRFTPPITQLLSLLPGDLKRPISDFAQKFTDRQLIPDARQVLATLQPMDVEVRTDAGRWYLRRILPYRTQDDRIGGVVITFTDITERRQMAEERLRLAAIVESSGAAIISTTLEGRILSWNRGAERMYGYSAKEAMGRNLDLVVPPEGLEGAREQLARIGQGQVIDRLETTRVRRDGIRLDVELTLSPVYHADTGELIGAAAIERDVSAHKLAEEQIRRAKAELEEQVAQRTAELSRANHLLIQEVEERRRSEEGRKFLLRRVVTIENDERRRISRELHDQIGQYVAALTLRLKALEAGVADRETLAAAQKMVDDLGSRVHDLALEVRPTALDDVGLLAALRNYAEDWGQRHGIELDYHDGGFDDRRLAPVLEETIYRVVLEALFNVAKHAQARRVSVILERRNQDVGVIVEDDGVGFDADALSTSEPSRRLGIIGMEERTALVDGTLTVEARPGGGTTVFLRVPLVPSQPTLG